MNREPAALLAVALALGAAACGGSSSSSPAAAPPPQAPQAPLNSAFTGTWIGSTRFDLAGFQPMVATNADIDVAVSGSAASVSRICPDNTGSVVGSGSGNSFEWDGSFTCPAVPATCGSVTVTFTRISGTLDASGTIAVTGNLNGNACGTPASGTFTFSGVKR